jgi:hypothetical protein
MLLRKITSLFPPRKPKETKPEQNETPIVRMREAPRNFSRRALVQNGVVRIDCQSIDIFGRDGRAWVVSSLKPRLVSEKGYPQILLGVVVFEKGSELEVIAESAFNGSRLNSIVIPVVGDCFGEIQFRQLQVA